MIKKGKAVPAIGAVFILKVYREDEVKTYNECIPCIVKQAYNTARRATDDPGVIKEILEATARHVENLEFERAPADNSNFVYRKTMELTGCDDPYSSDKRTWNDRCLELLPELG